MAPQSNTRELLSPTLMITALLILAAATFAGTGPTGARANSIDLENGSAVCNPTVCGEQAIYPILRGGAKGEAIHAKDGETICIEVHMDRNPQQIEIFGYSVTFNAARLTLQSIQRGPLLANFASDCNQSQPGLIVCSGFSEIPLPANSSGVLATLCFLVSCPPNVVADSSDLTIKDLRDDMSTLSACCNLFICSNPPASPCPGAALYLNSPGAAIDAPLTARPGDLLTVSASIKEIAQPLDAFSFTLAYDTHALKFSGAQAGALLASFSEKLCREVEPGKLLCSGLGNAPIPPNSQGELFSLSFTSQCEIGDTSRFILSALTDDLSAAGACNNIFVCKPCRPEACDGPAIYVTQAGRSLGERLREQNGDSLRMEIRVKSSPHSIAAFGFRVQYDPAKLSFGSSGRGALTRNFAAATARLSQPGTLICAGFGPAAIPRDTEGALLELRFGITCNVGDSSEIRITDLTDDLIGLQTCCNFFVCAPCDHDGDVNGNKLLTAGDALCAFETFLNGGILSPSCDLPQFDCELVAADVNCDNAVTSRDALEIFNRALRNLPPADCFAKVPGALQQLAFSPTQVKLLGANRAHAASDTLRLQLQIVQPQGVEAFGLLLQYPTAALQFLGARRTAATQAWTALEGRQYLPGFIVLGGFHHEALYAENPTAIVELYFHGNTATFDASGFAVSNLVDDFAGGSFSTILDEQTDAAAPQQFKLYQNYPNPLSLRAGQAPSGIAEVTIRYDLPEVHAQAGGQVEVTIYNIQGQVVRRLFDGKQNAGAHTLTWNGRDEAGVVAPSGVYFYRVRAGSFTASRKLLLIE
ncbi:MAG: FlgD immunoglobulin-like domain containing protein [bacterium]